MKALLVATLVSFAAAGAFAAENTAPATAPKAVATHTKVTKAERVAARKACQKEGKKGKALKSCVKGKLSAQS